ncbi:MAG: MogA/MoaB family molybdenum cofactor biosynthesis protein [Proteobacteria bacterium]|nr:MogA/MoaB family molybdenum cofactor biosynthesis protein [Pseudomonadota bacterium]
MNESYAPFTLAVSLDLPLAAGETIIVAPAGALAPSPTLRAPDGLPLLPVGARIGQEDCPDDLLVESVLWLPAAEPGQPALRGLLLRALTAVAFPAGRLDAIAQRRGMAVAVVILSDKGARGERKDECAPLIHAALQGKLDICHVRDWIIPDDPTILKALLMDLCLTQRFDLVLTSGGTGVAPRDLTPEATLAVIEKRLPGYERAMTAASLVKTPHGAISRAVAGTLGGALVVNLPGSPKAVTENLAPLVPTLKHTIMKLQGDPTDCALIK